MEEHATRPSVSAGEGARHSIETRLTNVEAKLEHMATSSDISRLEAQIAKIEMRLSNQISSIETRHSNQISSLETRLLNQISSLETLIATRETVMLRWVVGIVGTAAVFGLGLLATLSRLLV